jgi:DNA adenine methylase
MSYDNTSEVTEWASQMKFDTRAISMKNTHHATMSELLIGKNMAWFDLSSKAAA